MAYRRRAARKSYGRRTTGYSRGRRTAVRSGSRRGATQRQQVVRLVIQQGPAYQAGVPGLVGISQNPPGDGRRTF